jgi:hypothetical protein
MGRFRVELDGSHSATLQQYYSYHWAPIGNLGVDLLVRWFAPVLGLEAATKLVIVAIPMLTVAGLLWVAREVHGRVPPIAFLAIPFVYGHPFLYGFVNFALAMALAFLAFALWLRLGRLGSTWIRAAFFIPISFVIFFAHAFGWGLLGLMCLSAEAVRQRNSGAGWPQAIFQAAAQTSSMAAPLAIMILWRGNAHGPWAWAWFDWHAKLVWIETALRDRWAWLDVASVAMMLFVIIGAARDNRLGFARELSVPALVLTAVFLLLPTTLFGSAYADMRLVPYIFALALLSVRFTPQSARQASIVAGLALAIVALRLGANTISLAFAADDQREKSGAVAHLPIGVRVVSFAGIECGGGWTLPRNIHLASLATVRRQAFANDQWVIEGAFGLEIKYRRAGDFGVDPSQQVLPNGCSDGVHRTIDHALKGFPRDAFDYVWLIDPPAFDRRLLAGLEPVWEDAGSSLYRIRH